MLSLPEFLQIILAFDRHLNHLAIRRADPQDSLQRCLHVVQPVILHVLLVHIPQVILLLFQVVHQVVNPQIYQADVLAVVQVLFQVMHHQKCQVLFHLVVLV